MGRVFYGCATNNARHPPPFLGVLGFNCKLFKYFEFNVIHRWANQAWIYRHLQIFVTADECIVPTCPFAFFIAKNYWNHFHCVKHRWHETRAIVDNTSTKPFWMISHQQRKYKINGNNIKIEFVICQNIWKFGQNFHQILLWTVRKVLVATNRLAKNTHVFLHISTVHRGVRSVDFRQSVWSGVHVANGFHDAIHRNKT